MERRSRIRWPWFAVTLLALASGVFAQSSPRPMFPAAIHARGLSIGPSDSASCARCHAEIAREWEASLHRHAWDDRFFQRAYGIEPLAFCRNCHDPRHAEAPRDAISCAVCHVRDATVVGAARHGAARAASAHAFRTDGTLSTSRFCAPCHQFEFPITTTAQRSHDPLQDTYSEWERSTSAARGETCQDCHMPARRDAGGRSYRSHSFATVSDATMLSRAIDMRVVASRNGDAVEVDATFAPGAVGHAFPTGDLFRRLEWTVWIEDSVAPPERVVFEREYEFARTAGPHGVTDARRQVADTRIASPGTSSPRQRHFTFPARRGARLHWRLEHLRMPPDQARLQGFSRDETATLIREDVVDVDAANGNGPATRAPVPDRTPRARDTRTR